MPSVKFQTLGSIEIVTGEKNIDNPTQDSNGYQISYYSPNNYRTLVSIVTDYKVIDTGMGGDFKYSIQLRNCDGTWVDGANVQPNTIVIDTSIKCPVSSPDSKLCYIKVIKDGKQIHEATGTCPVSFTVACGENCPPGHIKCEHPGYPGYCCLPCKPTAGKINNLANRIT